MDLSELEQAFAENLILLGAISGPQLLYPLSMKPADPRPLWEIVGGLQLAPQHVLQEAHSIAEAAIAAAGPSAFSFSEGAMVGSWELQEPRGQAAGGEVWYARQEGRQATLRLIPPGSGHDPDRVGRFVERSNAGLDPPHPAILRIDEAEEDFGWLYTASVGMDCRSLAALRAPGPLPEATAIAMAQSVAGSLSVVHDLGVVHGGLTPLGVLIREQRIYLSDFGVCSTLLDGPLRGYRPGGRLGVLLFSSPGLITGDAVRGLEARDDMFSLGALLLFSLAGPGPGDQRAAPDAPWLVEPPVSPGLRTVLLRLLSPHPQGRYPTARSLLDDLNRVASGALPGPLPQSETVRGRRAEAAMPQQVLRAEVFEAIAATIESSSDLRLPESEQTPVEVEVIEVAVEVLDESGFEGSYEAPPEPQQKKKSFRAPKARASLAEIGTKPARSKGGGWLVFVFSLIIALGSIVTGYNVGQPVGADMARNILVQVEAELASDEPAYADALRQLDRAIAASGAEHPEVLRDVIRTRDRVLSASEGERLRLLPKGSSASSDEVLAARKQLEGLELRSLGLPVAELIRYDLSLADKEENIHIWGRIADGLLAAGHLAEAHEAYLRNGSKNGQNFTREAMASMVFLPAGPYLLPGEKDKGLRLVQRGPCYLGKTEVTRADYAEFLAALAELGEGDRHRFCDQLAEPERKNHAPTAWTPDDVSKGQLPATHLDFYDALSYARWKEAQLVDLDTFLAAARSPLCSSFPWGQDEAKLVYANHGGMLAGPAPVGCFPGGAGACGALDLLGNVEEWISANSNRGAAPTFGGHYETPTAELKPVAGEPLPFETRSTTLGFRVMVPVKAPE